MANYNFLLEIFSEEIPAKMQLSSVYKLQTMIQDHFVASKVSASISPRHMCVHAADLRLQTEIVVKGPKVDAEKTRVEGFMRKHNLSNASALTIQNGVYFLKKDLSFNEAITEMSKTITALLAKMVWPKSMQWSDHELRWIRPIHSILCMLDDTILPVEFGHLRSSNVTYGHRSIASQPIIIPSADLGQYYSLLKAANVIVSQEERKTIILQQINHISNRLDLTLIRDEELLDEIVGLVENPKLFLGRIDDGFMSLPTEVLMISLKQHQKYLLVNDAEGKLAPYFMIVSDIKPDDGGKAIIAGNEKVLKARLSDAQHFLKTDLQKKFEDLAAKLHKIQFHQKVGSVFDKVMRVKDIAKLICKQLNISSFTCERAALLCKNDLVTQMVGEFPELQGIMGYYYAKASGENEEVAAAIRDHYKPCGPSDKLPQTLEGCIVSIADKLDTLQSLFSIGIKPTSTKDPYAMRRAAIGIIRMITAHSLMLEKMKLPVLSSVKDFILERAKHLGATQNLDQVFYEE